MRALLVTAALLSTAPLLVPGVACAENRVVSMIRNDGPNSGNEASLVVSFRGSNRRYATARLANHAATIDGVQSVTRKNGIPLFKPASVAVVGTAEAIASVHAKIKEALSAGESHE
jgi:hypothetical protein